ncbi:MAG: hypothetical protein JXR51_01665 [Bacteroidales bacterium]|nr:hypothetical protein [Bacteroidales bacterium]
MKQIGIFIILLLFVKCKNDIEVDNMMFVKNIRANEKQNLKKYKAYYIIPPAICISCNTHPMVSAYQMLHQNYPVKVVFECFPENYKVILTKLKNEEIINSENYFIDTLVKYNNYNSLTLVNKPIVIYIEKGNIGKVEFLDNENPNAIYDLILYLQK